MALSAQRIDRGHPTAYAWERKAIDQVLGALPDVDPIHAWELHELHDPTTGRLYEIDLLVLARHALYLVEVKSHPGELTGDALDWTLTEPGARPRTLANPDPGANHKARVLADLLERAIKPDLRRYRPYIQPLIFLSQATSVQLEGGRPPWLVTSKEVIQVLTQGIPSIVPRQIVDNRIMREVVAAARRLGLRPAAASRVVGGYRLQHVVDEGEGYQEHSARHTSVDSDRARVRTWLVPQASSVERRQQLERAGRRSPFSPFSPLQARRSRVVSPRMFGPAAGSRSRRGCGSPMYRRL